MIKEFKEWVMWFIHFKLNNWGYHWLTMNKEYVRQNGMRTISYLFSWLWLVHTNNVHHVKYMREAMLGETLVYGKCIHEMTEVHHDGD